MVQAKVCDLKNNWMEKENYRLLQIQDMLRSFSVNSRLCRFQPLEESVFSLTLMHRPWSKNQKISLRDGHSISIFNSTICGKICDAGIDKLLQSSVIMELDYMPTVAKTTKAIHQLSSDKILGEDGISPELNKHGGDALVAALSRLFKHLWLRKRSHKNSKILDHSTVREQRRQTGMWQPSEHILSQRGCKTPRQCDRQPPNDTAW